MLQTGDSGEDVGRIWNAINEAAKMGVEERVILCIIMQESTGNVGVGTPKDMDNNPTGGLTQAEGSPAFPGQYNLTQVCPHAWPRQSSFTYTGVGADNFHGHGGHEALQGQFERA